MLASELFMSIAPRPYSTPFSMTPAWGGCAQCSGVAASTVSMCASYNNVGPLPLPSVAMTLPIALTCTLGNPNAFNCATSSSATAPSCVERLGVWIRRWVNWTSS